MKAPFGTPSRHADLRGRADECAALDEMLTAIRRGESRAMVLRGEAGIGKTALLEYMAAAASDLTVVRAVGVESEMELAYAVLHQVCGPLLDRRDKLPDPQRQALEIVFGMSAGASPDRFLVGVAVLGLLTAASEQRPLLCMVDDAQWQDLMSALVLAFVARRLLAEPLGIVFAARERGDQLRDIPELEIHGLRTGEAKSLLASALRVKVDERVRDRIVAETRGNPLALLELPRGLSPAQLAGGFGVLGEQTLTGRIEESFVRRLESLPEETRRLLLVAAAEPVGDPLVLRRACVRLGIQASAARPAEADELVAIGERVIFRHPLVRSGVYRAADAAARREVHAALAEATDRQLDPDRRAWHLAAATARPSEQVARELERSAGRARARGGWAAAAAFLQRAAVLTAEPSRRADRALAAAQAHVHAGAPIVARGLLAEAATVAVGDLQRARVEQLSGQVEAAATLGPDAPLRLLNAAKRLEPLDVSMARDTYLQAWWAAVLAGRFAEPGGDLHAISTAARAAPPPAEDQRPSDVLLDGLATLITEGRAQAAPILRPVIGRFLAGQVSSSDWIEWGRHASTAAFALWDADGWVGLSARQIVHARESGALAALVTALNFHGVVATCCGDLELAISLVTEFAAVKEASGIQMAPYGARVLAAYRGGHTGEVALPTSTADTEVIERGKGHAVQVAGWADAILNNGLGRYAAAITAAREVIGEGSFAAQLALSELIEAATRLGMPDVADDALRRLQAVTIPGSDWAAGMEARARALLSDGADAERCYSESIACLAGTPLRPEQGRSHLLFGEWLRREGRRRDAREQLRAALHILESSGAEGFANRARTELVAAGAKVGNRNIRTRQQLTPQEWQVARMAGDGLSSPEIGARLFLSRRTVEWHLSNVFTKVGIHSRTELAAALAAPHRG